MLKTDLVEIINKGEAWAFIGSGVSADSGYPDWESLVNQIYNSLGVDQKSSVSGKGFKKDFESKKFERCFSSIENCIGRSALVQAVKKELSKKERIGDIASELADWPFAGYISTNYDSLLESALLEKKQYGWDVIGNTEEEVKLLSGNVTNVVWHIHGGIDLDSSKSHLVLTEDDYDNLYLNETPLSRQLQNILTTRRIVFFGFSFNDVELSRLMRKIKMFCTPARPAFAIISGVSGTENEDKRKELLYKYNIDVIPYRIIGKSHHQLGTLLENYGAFVLKRSLRFGQSQRECPSYDQETTGLLIYNTMVLKDTNSKSSEAVEALSKSCILSLLMNDSKLTIKGVIDELERNVAMATKRENINTIIDQIMDLYKNGYIEATDEMIDENTNIYLTEDGKGLVQKCVNESSALSRKFSKCIQDRVADFFKGDINSIKKIAISVETFFKDTVKNRALGLAMLFHHSDSDFKKFHIVALLQSLPEYVKEMSNVEEANALIHIVQTILSNPTDLEKYYLGVCLQAQFGVHLLGYDQKTTKLRAEEIAGSVYLIDSSTLIPFLAVSSTGHQPALFIIKRLLELNSQIITTPLLAEEAAEHARWAQDHFVSSNSTTNYAYFIGKSGGRSNAFLDGFVNEYVSGKIPDNFPEYLRNTCYLKYKTRVFDQDVISVLQMKGFVIKDFSDCEGFRNQLYAVRDLLQEQIAERRRGGLLNTYKHDRQVKAEAEATIIIQNLRNNTFKINSRTFKNSYFVSNTRIIDDLTSTGRRITIRPESLLSWVSTISQSSINESGLLFDYLLWELSTRGLDIVDKTKIKTLFSSLIHASSEKLQEEIKTHRDLIDEFYCEDSAEAFKSISDYETPLVIESIFVRKTEVLTARLDRLNKERDALLSKTSLSESEREELNKLRIEKKDKRKKSRSRLRAAKSKRKKKNSKTKK